MKLGELLKNLDDLDDNFTIYAEKNPIWSENSEAFFCYEDDNEIIKKEFKYFIEVWLAKEVIEVWSEWRNGQLPNPKEVSQAVIYYAENDSYIPLVN